MSSEFTFAEFTIDKTVTFISGLMGGLAAIVGVVTYFVSLFLEPGWINGTLFGLYDNFKLIWILVSNVVYFIFAFILIWIAFMNIIGKGEKWELKQALPKFVIGVLIVPFSWFFVQFVLSISAFLTVSALSLPYDTFTQYQEMYDKVRIPRVCNINLQSKNNDGTKNEEVVEGEEDNVTSRFFSCVEEDTVGLGSTFKNSSFGLISIYSYGILHLDKIDTINKEDILKGNIKTIGDLVLHILFNVLFILIFMILFISLGFVLAVRGMYLWLYTMLSPVFGLMYFFDKNEGGGDGVFSKFNIKEFISLALVPVYTMLALGFGLSFIFVILQGIGTPDDNLGSSKFKIDDKGIEIVGVLAEKDGKKGNFRLNVEGAIGKNMQEKLKGNESSGFLYNIGNSGLGIVGTLILQLLGASVLRISIMAALRSSDITKQVVEPIYNFGNQVGSLMAKSPQYAPIFGGVSMKGMEQIGATAVSHYDTKARDTGSDFLKDHGLFGQTLESSNAATNALKAIEANGKVLDKESAKKFEIAVNTFKSTKAAVSNKDHIINTELVAKSLGIDIENKDLSQPDVYTDILSKIDFEIKQNKNWDVDIIKGDRHSKTTQYNMGDHDKYLKSGESKGKDTSVTESKTVLKLDVTDKYNKIIAKDGFLDKGGKITDDELKEIAKMINAQLRQQRGHGEYTFDEFKIELEASGVFFDEGQLKQLKKDIEGFAKLPKDKKVFKEPEKKDSDD